ncbi:MAG: S46 family peptidase [Saprospiraceae bacterium]|nr:S46 family peptidase [Saprospiraceae bacterium]
MKKIALLIFLCFSLNNYTKAVEGMWIPSLIEMFHSDMQTYGLKLSPEDIYSTNKASLKDAIVQFNGGCTAEIVSEQGLLLTNHHCGFDAIQRHSSLENDYLKNGFWSKSQSEELACPWMRVTFVKEIRDVTKEVFQGISEMDLSTDEGMDIINKNIMMLERAESTNSIQAKIKPFNMGNQYYMLITEDYNDIRLVGTPPSAIGKYGGDTDNWVWPRHTGDFAVFRIYADKDNNSAKFNESNIPYKPDHFLPISLKNKTEGDFTMIYGFPGHTDQHYSYYKLKFYMEKERPSRIKMRQMSLDIIKPAMNKSDAIRIKYASKQARIANAWKKWIGQIGGLNELHALEKKEKWAIEYMSKAMEKDEWFMYQNVINDLNKLQIANSKYEFARSMFIEYFYVGPEFLRYAHQFNNIANKYSELKTAGKLDQEIKKLIGSSKGFFKNYDGNIDHDIFKALTPMYISQLDPELLPEGFKSNWSKNGEKVFCKSIIMNPEKINALLSNFNEKSSKKLQKDPALMMANDLFKSYVNNTSEAYSTFIEEEDRLMKIYVSGILTMFPEKKTWADANSTMRITYGKLEGSAPVDGMQYLHYSTIDGIMQKYDPENPDFQLTERFLELYNKKDFGDYLQDGELWVCFTASNHTTGGNSGSPVIDADGNLMGINFDRSWESTMSDFMFDESRCRNIAIDSRYLLWVIDKYGKAGHLIKEMKLIR